MTRSIITLNRSGVTKVSMLPTSEAIAISLKYDLYLRISEMNH